MVGRRDGYVEKVKKTREERFTNDQLDSIQTTGEGEYSRGYTKATLIKMIKEKQIIEMVPGNFTGT